MNNVSTTPNNVLSNANILGGYNSPEYAVTVNEDIVDQTWSNNIYFEENRDILADYLKEISKYKFVKADEERHLFGLVQEGNSEAFEKFISCYLRLAVWVAKRFKTLIYGVNSIEFIDLIQEGNIGLVRAMKTFDPDAGRFTTYASWWIRQNVTRFVSDFKSSVRIPVHMTEKILRYKKEYSRLSTKLKREPTQEEMSAEMKLTDEQMLDLLSLISRRYVSLDEPVNGSSDDGSLLLADVIPELQKVTPEERLDWKIARGRIRTKIKSILKIREYEVIDLRFGFTNNQPCTLQEIAVKFEVTRERIRQIEANAFQKLIQDFEFVKIAKEMGIVIPQEYIDEVKARRIQELAQELNYSQTTETDLETFTEAMQPAEQKMVTSLERQTVIEANKQRIDARPEILQKIRRALGESFNFTATTSLILRFVPKERAKDILIDRWGLEQVEKMTFESVAEKHSLTKQRVQQISEAAYSDLIKNRLVQNILEPFLQRLRKCIDTYGGVMCLETLYECFAEDAIIFNHILFYVSAQENIILARQTNDTKSYLSTFAPNLLKQIHLALDYISKTMLKEEMLEPFMLRMFEHLLKTQKISNTLINENSMIAWLATDKRIGNNSTIGEWGRSDSERINPKTAGDYAYIALILAEKESLHFREVCAKIKEITGEEVHVQTLHNALIKEERFMRTGQGLYAISNEDKVK